MTDSFYLELHDLHKSFGDVEVLRDLSLALAEGEILALLGPSGSGKTTALRLLAGFETPDHGRIRVGGEDVTSLGPARRGFGMVFQHYALFPHMTVRENIAFGLESQKAGRERIARRVEAMLALVDLEGFGDRRVSEISGGQQQRVALARALAPEPRVLLLDEPLSNLDPALRERTRREIREAVRQVGITTVLVTHEQEEAFHVGERVAVLHGGRLEQIGRPEDLYDRPASPFVATFIGRAGTLEGKVTGFYDGGLAEISLGGVRWRGRRGGELAEGRPALLAVRPEALELTASDVPDALPGRLLERRFNGVLTYVTVRLETGGELEVLVDAGRRLEAGETIAVKPRRQGDPGAGLHVYPVEPSP